MPSEKPCHPECTDSGPLTRLSPQESNQKEGLSSDTAPLIGNQKTH